MSQNNIVFDLIKEQLSNKDIIKKINLNDESIKVITLILGSNTTIFDDISQHIKYVIDDKVIDVNDIPPLILIIKDIININTNTAQINKLKLTREQIIIFIKNILFILIESETIKVKDKEIVKQLIELSVQLLSTKINVQKVVTCSWK
jgi:hypothetical protein